jgi:uncharacterized protein
MEEKLSQALIKHRLILCILSISITIFCASGLSHFIGTTADGRSYIKLSKDYHIFFGKHDPQLKAFDSLQETYGTNDSVLVVLTPKDKSIYSKEILIAIEELTEQAWQTPFSTRVESVTNYQHTSSIKDEIIVGKLVENAISLTDIDINKIKNIASNEPLLVNRLISDSGKTTGINIIVNLPGKNLQEEEPLVVDFVRNMTANFQLRHPDIEVHLTGIVMMNNAFPEATEKDSKTLMPAMMLLIFIIIWLLTHSIQATIASMLVISMSIYTALGIAGLIGINLSTITAAAPIMIIPLAITDSIHILTSYFNSLSETSNAEEAMKKSMRINLQPVFLTSITTAIGFLAMNFSESPPFQELGNIVAIGIISAFINSFFFLPAMMIRFSPKHIHRENTFNINRHMLTLSNIVVKRKTLIIFLTGIMILICLPGIFKNEINEQYVKYFDESIEFRRDTDYTSKNLTGVYKIEYSVPTADDEKVSNPEYLKYIDKFSTWYRQQQHVTHIYTISDIFKRLNKNMHSDDELWNKLPVNPELSAQYLLLYEMSLPYAFSLDNMISFTRDSSRFVVTIKDLSTKELIKLENLSIEWQKQNFPPHMRTKGASPTIMFAKIASRNTEKMIWGTVTALILISIILMLALKSFKFGLLSLIPNLIPIGLGFGVWGYFHGQIDLSLSIVASLTLGIVVDDTVHFLSKYLSARRKQNLTTHESIQYALTTVGPALFITTITLSCGFLMLTFSTFQPHAGMGALTTITIVFALLLDILLLPSLLAKYDKQ